MAIQTRYKFNTMLKRLGKPLLFKLLTKTTTDDFYQTSVITETEFNCNGVVVPARAYDLHSNIFMKSNDTGNEFFGIVNIYLTVSDAENIRIEDHYIDGNKKYNIVSKEFWNDEFIILEGHLIDVDDTEEKTYIDFNYGGM